MWNFIYKLKKIKKFKRIFEEIDKELIFLKITRVPEEFKNNIHLFYHNHKNPPFDVAINENDFGIEYITFCLDEITGIIYKPIKIILKEESLYFKFKEIAKNYTFNFEGDFSNFLFQNDLIILQKGNIGEIYGYRLTDNTYILIDENDNIIGIYLKNLSIDEMNSLKNTNIL